MVAAVISGAGVIVTHNVKDFPDRRLPAGLQARTPQQFVLDTVSLGPACAQAAVSAIADRSGRHGPRLTCAEILDRLEKIYGMV